MSLDEEAFFGMRPDRTYVSKAFPELADEVAQRKMRYVSKVIDADTHDCCELVDTQEIVIRETPGGRQQIKVLFFEDDRSVKHLIIQRFTTDGMRPSKKQYFSFSGEELDRLRWVLEVVDRAELDASGKIRFADQFLDEALGGRDGFVDFVLRHREILAQHNSADELAAYLAYCERQRQVEIFRSLLYDSDFFQRMRSEWGCRGDEAVWQAFFERNSWIFGLQLSPLYLSSLDGKKLEQVVRGFSITGEGKRADALMRTNGLLSALCFVEIKTHNTPLLQEPAYRSGAWRVSAEVAGGVAQCHATVESAIHEVRSHLLLADGDGNPTGEELFLYQPRSYLIVGSLNEFRSEHGPNQGKFRSFELYRRHLRSPEIVTYDELYERAAAMVAANKRGSLQ
jgi:hypothetical protein